MSQSSIEYSEELLANLGWLRQLAERLAGDCHLAEDLTQSTYVRALESRPRDRSRIREWLASILRNSFLQEHRRRKTRLTREVRSARPERQVSTADIVSRASTQKALVAAVLAMEEPFRSSILLRFFEELPPRRIAERMDCSVATVNSRLSRGLEKLRRELDRSHGGRRDEWLSALALLLRRPAKVAALGTIMNSKIKIVLASAIVMSLCALGYGLLPAPKPELVEAGPKLLSGFDELDAPAPASQIDPLVGREDLPDSSENNSEADRESRLEEVRGRVLDPVGASISGIPVVVADGDDRRERGISDALGEFVLHTQRRALSLVTDSPDHVTVFSAEHALDSPIRPAIVAAERLHLAGIVVDADGLPLAGVHLSLVYPDGFEAGLGIPLDRSKRRGFSSRTDSEGRFSLPEMPRIPAASLRAQLEPYAQTVASLPAHSDKDMYLVMRRVDVGEEKIMGRVVDLSGQPVPEARVSLGMTSSLSDSDGLFELGLDRAAKGRRILAVKAGMLPASYEFADSGAAEKDDWPAWVELRLGEEPYSISGRVLDAAGEPVSAAMLWIEDPSPFGLVGIVPVQVEGIMAGAAVGGSPELPAEVLDNPMQGEHSYNLMNHAREPSASWHFVQAAADGSFTFPGLQKRSYRIRAMDPESLHSVSLSAEAGSSGVLLELPGERSLQSIAGVLVDEDGQAIAGATISQIRRVFHTNQRVPGGQLDGTLIRHGPRTKSDAQGRFRFAPSSQENILLSIFGDGILPLIPDLADEPDWSKLRYTLQRRYHFELVVAPELADAIEVRGPDGQQMVMALLRSGSTSMDARRPLEAGRSGVLAVSGKIRSILLIKDDQIVKELPVSLRPGRTNVIRH